MEELCVNNLRVLSLYEIEKAKSGHPGVALSAAPIFYSLYSSVLNYDTFNDKSIFRDRFVVSAGHSSSLLYATLHLFGFDVSMDDLKSFRQLGSKTPGHPEVNKTNGVDCSTGPLGQGVANAVGMAIAAKYYAEKFNKEDIKLFDNKIYCFVGDGCLMEGISYEATSLAGNLKLDNLVLIYDRNKRTIDGATDITWTEDIKKRFEAIGFDVFEVQNGNDVNEITTELLKAKNNKRNPSIVIVNTRLGFGSELEDDSKVHGTPLSLEQIERVKQNLRINVQPFEILPEVKQYIQTVKEQVREKAINQDLLFQDYQKKYPQDYEKLLSFLSFEKCDGEIAKIDALKLDYKNSIREINHEIFSTINLENMLGGSADVEASTKMFNGIDKDFSSLNYAGKKLHFGIREHAMASVCNGITLFGGLLAYCSCFFSFMDYLKPALRMTCLMNLPVLYLFTHDSLTIGEDGPTHQPVEQLVSINAIPNIKVFRAYNDDEIKFAYSYFLKNRKPTALIISRSKYDFIPIDIDDIKNGGYIVKKAENNQNQINLVSTGSDVAIALETAKLLKNKNINANVISLSCLQLFDEQPKEYREKVLNTNLKSFGIECGSTYNLDRYVPKGNVFGMEKFGESAPANQLLNYFELTPEKIAEKIEKKLK